MNKIKKLITPKAVGLVVLSMLMLTMGLAFCANIALADDMPTATGTLDTLGGAVVNSGVSLATIYFTKYWPFGLAFLILAAVIGWITGVFRHKRR